MNRKCSDATTRLCSADAMRSLPMFCALIVALLGVAITACSDSSDAQINAGAKQYSALIERTQYGTAHITADDWGSLGFGQGYAFAQDRFCVLADQIVKVRSERSRYFGPGENNRNTTSDLSYLALGLMEKAPALIDALSEETRSMLNGYVAGFNQYLSDMGAANIPGDCSGADWLQPINANSLMAYYIDVFSLASSRSLLPRIAGAEPPGAGDSTVSADAIRASSPIAGSNVFAFGEDSTSTGYGMLLSNTHLNWEGELKYHEAHLTIPGQIDVAGVALSGFLGIVNGFNEHIAWSHTSSTSFQYIIYSLDLVPGSPTRYYYGDEEREMEVRTYSLEVLQPDGSTRQEQYKRYHSQYGPMLNPGLGLTWTNEKAYTLFDPNLNNSGSVDILLQLDRAGSITELQTALEQVGSAPFNIIVAQHDGQTFYGDATPVPKISESAEAAFLELVTGNEPNDTQRVFSFPFNLGFVLLDGSDPEFAVVYDDRAALPGTIPFADAPRLARRDFVGNSNASYWLSNPQQPLTGYSIRYGDVEAPRSLRTRMGLRQVTESSNWTRTGLEEMLFANRSFTEELWRDNFASYCQQSSQATASNGDSVDISQACNIINTWDGFHNLESVGAMLFREVTTSGNGRGELGGKSYFSEPFDVSRPIDTPAGITQEGLDYLLTQLANTVQRLNRAGIPLDGALGEYQYTLRGAERFPIHGGQTIADGAFNVVNYIAGGNSTLLPGIPVGDPVNGRTGLTEDGYPVNDGPTWIMALEFTENGPVADTLLVYSQSDDPLSAHFSDQTALYSNKTWRPLPFAREQIEADPFLTSLRITN